MEFRGRQRPIASSRTPNEIEVSSAAKSISVTRLGFKRRVVFASSVKRDLRIGNYLYVALASAVGENEKVHVENVAHNLLPTSLNFSATNNPQRWSPVLHVNQTGYLLDFPKVAKVGYYLGSFGELDVAKQGASQFKLIDAKSGATVFSGPLRASPDQVFPNPCYQQVLDADFTQFKTPGEYRLWVAGLGFSFQLLFD